MFFSSLPWRRLIPERFLWVTRSFQPGGHKESSCHIPGMLPHSDADPVAAVITTTPKPHSLSCFSPYLPKHKHVL